MISYAQACASKPTVPYKTVKSGDRMRGVLPISLLNSQTIKSESNSTNIAITSSNDKARKSRPKISDPIEIKINLRAHSANIGLKSEQRKESVTRNNTNKLEKIPDNQKKKRSKPLKNRILIERANRKLRSQSLPRPQEQDTINSDIKAELAMFGDVDRDNSQPEGRIVFQQKCSALEKQLAPLLMRLQKIHDDAFKKTTNHKNFFRRIVCGFHEVANHLTQGRLKFIVIARDIEGKAGLYEALNSKEDFDSVLKKYHFNAEPEAARPIKFNRFGIPKVEENEKHTNSCIESAIILKEARNTSLDEYIKTIYRVAKQLKCPVFYGFTRRELKRMTRKPNLVACLGVLSVQDIKRDFDEFMESFENLLPQPIFQTLELDNVPSCLDQKTTLNLTDLGRFFAED